MDVKKKSANEFFKVTGDEILSKVKEIIKEGNAIPQSLNLPVFTNVVTASSFPQVPQPSNTNSCRSAICKSL